MRCRGLLLVLLGFALFGGVASAQQTCPNRPASVPGEQLGCSVAANGDVIAYGANLGNRVLVSQGNGFQSLTASDGASGDMFGFSIAIDGDSLAVGAPTADGPGGPDSGAVYVFRKQEGRWVQEAKLTAGDGAPGAQLGFSLALRNGTLAAGAATDGARGSLSGAVYVFERAGTTWTQRAKLTGARTRAFDELGAAVALDGGVLVAGAPFEDRGPGGNQGGVHLFEQRGGTWTETGTLTPSGAASGDELGFAVSIQGDTVAAGARRADVNGKVDAGWVTVFRRDGGVWRESARLTAGASAQVGELFGGAVSLSGARLLVGASQADGSHGATYLFEETAPGAWTLLQRMKPPDDQGPGRFGFAVALSGATVVAGAFMANGGAGFVACDTVPLPRPPETVPSLAIDDVSLAEGNSGTKPFAFTVSLSSPAGAGGVTFDVATAPGTARAGTDYVTRRLTRQTISAGSSTYTFNVPVKGDTSPEPNETFFVNVRNVTGANVADGQGLGTILNDDVPGQPILTIGDVSLNEGNSGTTAFSFTISLSAPAPPGGVRFDVATVPGTATAGSDYIPKSLAGQKIPAGSSTYAFEVPVRGDTSLEANETFFVHVANVTGAVVAGSGEGRGAILNDDQEPDSADLSVTKVDTPDPVTAGNNLTYTITVDNAGPSAAAGVSLSDTLPAGTTFVALSSPGDWSCTKPPVGSGGTISCTNPSLAVGSAVFTASVAVDPSTPNGTILANTASVSSATADPNPGNESGTATTTVRASADLSVTKVDTPDPVAAGNNLTYTITITNAGPNAAANVNLSDVLPAGTTFVSLSSPSGWSCTKPQVGSGGTVTCARPSLAVGSAVFTLVVAIPLSTPNGTILTNTASASSTTPDPNPGNESSTAATTVGTSADLSVTKVDTPDPVAAGNNLTYTITVTNTGPNSATGVTLNDTLPAGTTFASLSSPAGWSCITPAVGSGGTISCLNASLALGSSIFTLTVAVDPLTPAGTILTNTATAASATPDLNAGNESGTATTTVGPPPGPPADLSITKTDGVTTATPGGLVIYAITVSNAGPSNATGATVADTFPAALTCAWTCVGAGGGTCTPASSGNINDTVNLPAGGSITYTAFCTIAIAATGTLSNTATVTAPGGVADPTSGNNSATDSDTLVASADLSVTKVDTPDPVPAGGNLTYTITVTNAGPSSAASVSLNDSLPAGTTFMSLSSPGGWSCITPAIGAGGSVVCSNPSLALVNAIFTLTVAVAPSTLPGTILTNTASITSATADPSPGDNMATANTAVTTLISGTKSVSGKFFQGGTITYAVVLTNNGPNLQVDDLGSDEFTDTLPASLTLVSVTATSGTAMAPAGTVHWNGALSAGASVTITITATINAAAGTITNQGVIFYDADGNGSNETSALTDDPSVLGAANPTSFQVQAAPTPIAGSKSVSGTFVPGGTVTYTVMLTDLVLQNDNPGNEFTDVLAPLLILVSATASSGTVAANTGTNTVTWNGTIPAGGSVTITMTATISAGAPVGTTITNQGTISFDSNNDGINESTALTNPVSFQVQSPSPLPVQVLPQIPTLDAVGLSVLTMLLALGGATMLRRRRE